MKKIYRQIKRAWCNFWEHDEDDTSKMHLSKSDKRWLLYWNVMAYLCIVIAMTLIFTISKILTSH